MAAQDSPPWLSQGWKRVVHDAAGLLLRGGDISEGTHALRSMRENLLPGVEPTARVKMQLHVLHAAAYRIPVHNGVMKVTVGLLPTGAGKSLIMYLLPRVLDVLYGRGEADHMRCYICIPLQAYVCYPMAFLHFVSPLSCARPCSLRIDQCTALNAMGGECAHGVVINEGLPDESIKALFKDKRNLYFFYAAESKTKHAGAWHNEFVAQKPLGAPRLGAPADILAFVHVIDEAHVVVTWARFRDSFCDFRALLAGVPLHHTVRLFVSCMQCLWLGST